MSHEEKQFQKFMDRQLTPVCQMRLRKIGLAAKMNRLSRTVAELGRRRQAIIESAESLRADCARLGSA